MSMAKKTINFLQEFSIPLISGVLAALIWANVNEHTYHHFMEYPLLGEHFKIFGHAFNFHFLMNDIFMVLFFGIATVEITQAVGPGGSLNPISKAINPIFGTLGGVLGPILTFFILCYIFPMGSLLGTSTTGEPVTMSAIMNGWGVPTATDIALAWLVARIVFGASHPAISYLLLLAILDDAIGLGIIAIFYPNPNYPVEPIYLTLTALGMAVAFGFRKFNIKSFWPYLLGGGFLSWLGLILAHLHPALALVFIVPFMPLSSQPHGEIFEDEDPHQGRPQEHKRHSSLVNFEHFFKLPVDFGLFGFGLANAGVLFAGINAITWLILFSLVLGKTLGISLLGFLGEKLGFQLPEGMNIKSLVVTGVIAGLGLTVALFVSGEAYTNPQLQGAAKMGALFSIVAAPIALGLGRLFNVKAQKENP